jgi:NurA domain
MPHEGERGGVTGSLRRLLDSPEAEAMRAEMHIETPVATGAPPPTRIVPRPAPEALPHLVIAIDGSEGHIPLKNGFPGAEAAVITIAAVFIDLRKLRDVEDRGIPNPRRFKDLHGTEGIELLLPSTNVVLGADPDARSSFRRKLHDTLAARRIFEDGETLLETYEVLLASRPERTGRPPGCPLLDLCPHNDATYVSHAGVGTCACGDHPTYSIDALRGFEAFNDAASNQTAVTETRSAIEHLTLVNILRYFERHAMWRSIRTVAIVMDGPLAVSGGPAWLSGSIKVELARLAKLCYSTTGSVPTVFGIEKTGMFQDHLLRLAHPAPEPGTPGVMPDPRTVRRTSLINPGEVLLVNDAYVKKNIIFKHEVGPGPFKPYGSTSHYGRKALYHTTGGALITLMPAFLRPGDDETLVEAQPEQFPNLPVILSLLDTLVSDRYPNATIPLVVAHAEAAIPAHANAGVLRRFLRGEEPAGVTP